MFLINLKTKRPFNSTLPEDWDRFITSKHDVTCVIPIFHGEGGEDGEIQRALDELDIPYIFSSPEAHKLGLDKKATKRLVADTGIAVPRSHSLSTDGTITYTDPVVIKPNNGGSSIGVTIAQSQHEIDTGIEAAQEEGDVVIEDYVAGREFTVAVIEYNSAVEALPIIEVKPKGRSFFDFESKYDAELVDEICPAEISKDLTDRLQKTAISIHKAIDARHLTRSDFIVDDAGTIWFLEINTIPGATLNSLVPKALKIAGIDFTNLLLEWVNKVI